MISYLTIILIESKEVFGEYLRGLLRSVVIVQLAFHLREIAWGGTPLYGLYSYARPKGYSFSAVLVINRVSIIVILPPLW